MVFVLIEYFYLYFDSIKALASLGSCGFMLDIFFKFLNLILYSIIQLVCAVKYATIENTDNQNASSITRIER